MPNDARPNVVFVVLDTCRADVFYQLLDEGHLPGIKRIAADGKTYRNASAVAPWTVPSHASLFSGLYPTDHETSANDPYFNPPTPPLAARLRSVGYETVGLSANPWITPSFDFTTGFEKFKTANELLWGGEDISDLPKIDSRWQQTTELLDRTSIVSLPKTLANAVYGKFFSKRNDSGAKHLTSDAISWLTKRSSDDPFFLFCNYMESHIRYDPPTEFLVEELPTDADKATARSVNQDPWAYVAKEAKMSECDFKYLNALYRATIRYLDTQLVRLYDKLADENLLDDTVIVLVGDHGENIGNHKLMDHQYCLYETLLHVPLVIRYPTVFDAGSTNELVETRSLYETIASLVGLNSVDANTAPPLTSDKQQDYAIAEYASPQPSVDKLDEEYGPLDSDIWGYDRALRSIRSKRWKLIEGSDGKTEFYDLKADPDESELINRENAKVELQQTLKNRRGKLGFPDTEPADINSANKERLQDLGYL